MCWLMLLVQLTKFRLNIFVLQFLHFDINSAFASNSWIFLFMDCTFDNKYYYCSILTEEHIHTITETSLKFLPRFLNIFGLEGNELLFERSR